MMKRSCLSVLLCILAICAPASASPSSFVSVRDGKFQLNGKPLYYIGTNYWYGSLLGKEKNSRKGINRLRKELDFLKRNGVTNLRLLAGAEGSGCSMA